MDAHGESARGDWLFPLAVQSQQKQEHFRMFLFLPLKLSTFCRQLERFSLSREAFKVSTKSGSGSPMQGEHSDAREARDVPSLLSPPLAAVTEGLSIVRIFGRSNRFCSFTTPPTSLRSPTSPCTGEAISFVCSLKLLSFERSFFVFRLNHER